MSDLISRLDIGKDLQNAFDEGYKQGRYDEKVETEMSLPSVEQTHVLRTETHAVRSDTISRQDAIEAVLNICNTPCNEYFANAIKALPSARPTGEWIETEVAWECSECGYDRGAPTRFCPNCGAYMKGAIDE